MLATGMPTPTAGWQRRSPQNQKALNREELLLCRKYVDLLWDGIARVLRWAAAPQRLSLAYIGPGNVKNDIFLKGFRR